jgi:hypothetical protein
MAVNTMDMDIVEVAVVEWAVIILMLEGCPVLIWGLMLLLIGRDSRFPFVCHGVFILHFCFGFLFVLGRMGFSDMFWFSSSLI